MVDVTIETTSSRPNKHQRDKMLDNKTETSKAKMTVQAIPDSQDDESRDSEGASMERGPFNSMDFFGLDRVDI